MQKTLLSAAALLAAMHVATAALAQEADAPPPMIPPPSTDGGINTGAGTTNGKTDFGPDTGGESVTDPSGDNTKSGGINSGPAGSLPDTNTIPSR